MPDTLRAQLQAALGTNYVIRRELGGGGMSRVFLADDVALERQIVIKVLAPDLAAGVNADRFRREILLAAGLQHPHIVPILSAGEVRDSPDAGANVLPYFTMPYVEGDSLRTRLEKSGRQSIAETVAIIRDIAKGLSFAHARGIVHRDIKPENVLLSGGSAAVTDFGVAKALSSSHRTGAGGDALTILGMSLGTPAYMAPEQAAGDPDTDHRADLYSLGLIGYEMLAGQSPFAGRSPQATIAAHMVEKPAPVTRQRKDTPPALAALIMRCLEKEPSARPETAEALLAELDAAPSLVASRRMRIAVAVAAAVIIIAVAAIAWFGTRSGSARASSADLRAIAVLPLVNTTGDPQDEYFSDGMTDELATSLSRVPGLRVASRTSTFAFKGRSDVDVREIGRRLGVGAVIEGTVRRDGQRMRLSAQLTNIGDGLSLWSETYEREVSDVFEVQNEIASSIVAALAPRLVARAGETASGVVAPAATRRTRDLAAYDEYLRGRYFWHQRGETALRTAGSHFERAIALDSGFAAAYAGLADVLALLPVYGATPGDSAYPLARAAAERAIALDSASAEAHTTLGLVHKSVGEWEAAERALQRALALDPGAASAHQWRAEVLVITGRSREAAAAARQAHQLDPLSPIVAGELGYMLTLAGESEAGIAMGRRAIELAPNLWAPHAFLGSSFLFAGRLAESIGPLERAVQLDRNVSLFRGVLAFAYAKTARQDDARRLLAELEREAERGAPASPIAIAYVGLGDTVRALDWLERAARERDPYLLQMSLTPTWFDAVRGSARFAEIARSLRLDPVLMARPAGLPGAASGGR